MSIPPVRKSQFQLELGKLAIQLRTDLRFKLYWRGDEKVRGVVLDSDENTIEKLIPIELRTLMINNVVFPEHVPLFIDYFHNALPLYAPTDYMAVFKLKDYFNEQLKFHRFDKYYKWEVSIKAGVNIFLQVSEEGDNTPYVQFLHLMLSLIYPKMSIRDRNSLFLNESNEITIYDSARIYHDLWKKKVFEPLQKYDLMTKLEQFISSADLRKLIGEYHTRESLDPKYQELLKPYQGVQLSQDVISTFIEIKDIRDIIDSYSIQVLAPVESYE